MGGDGQLDIDGGQLANLEEETLTFHGCEAVFGDLEVVGTDRQGGEPVASG